MNRVPDDQAHEPIQHVHVIFKTHLDLGFTDLAARVVDQYFDQFIPRALELARSTRESGDDDRFIWTTGAWLIFEYLERSGRAARERLEEGIEHGDIVWHGLPFTTHTELMNAALFRHGLSLSRRLDERFGRKTIAGKMTDVPGHTRAMIPLLANAGIRFLHLGVNPGSTAPAVPELFRWQHPEGSELLVMIHKGDYGQTSVVPEASLALAFAHTRDNEGPQTAAEVSTALTELRHQFPHSTVHAASLNDAAALLLPLSCSES